MAIVKANYLHHRAGGHLRRLGRAVAYYSWREASDERPREQPRTWYSADGRRLDYAAARREITQGARESAYAYRVVLSTAAVALAPADYASVLNRQFDRWFLVLHHGGPHPHAHAVALSARRLEARQLNDLREALTEREGCREAEWRHAHHERTQRDGLSQTAFGRGRETAAAAYSGCEDERGYGHGEGLDLW